jgi:hypothetical protein
VNVVAIESDIEAAVVKSSGARKAFENLSYTIGEKDATGLKPDQCHSSVGIALNHLMREATEGNRELLRI